MKIYHHRASIFVFVISLVMYGIAEENTLLPRSDSSIPQLPLMMQPEPDLPVFRPGYINGQEIAFSTLECQTEMAVCKAKQDAFINEMQQKEQDYVQSQNELAAKRPTLSEQAFKKEQRKLAEKERKAKEDIEEGKQELQTAFFEATEKVNAIIVEAAATYAAANEFSIIQDKNTGQIYYLDPAFDINEEFVAFMNDQYTKKMAAAAKKGKGQSEAKNQGKV